MTCDTCKNRKRAFDCPVLKYDADNHCFEECHEYEEVTKMKTCKDCIHENICVIKAYPDAFENTQWDKEPCDHFKDKSLIFNLPCKVGDTVYMPQRAAFPKGVVSAIHLNGRRSHIMIDVDFHFRAKHYLDEYGVTWFTSPESAEQALKEREI